MEITVRSPEKITDTSGVVSYLSSNLAENSINVAETVSCYTDTIFIVDEKDMIAAYSLLSRIIESAEQATQTE